MCGPGNLEVVVVVAATVLAKTFGQLHLMLQTTWLLQVHGQEALTSIPRQQGHHLCHLRAVPNTTHLLPS
jgi:hypothetical protein